MRKGADVNTSMFDTDSWPNNVQLLRWIRVWLQGLTREQQDSQYSIQQLVEPDISRLRPSLITFIDIREATGIVHELISLVPAVTCIMRTPVATHVARGFYADKA